MANYVSKFEVAQETQNVLVDAFCFNRGFASKKLNAEQVNPATVNAWHTLCNRTLELAYSVASTRINEDGDAQTLSLQAQLAEVAHFIGKVNGLYIKSDANMANEVARLSVAKGYAVSVTYNDNSVELRMANQSLKVRKDRLARMEAEGTHTTKELDEVRQSIKQAQADIEKFKEVQKNLYDEQGNKWRMAKMANKTGFYKDFEDLIASKIMGLKILTLEEVQAIEAERKAAKAARQKARRKEKKQEQQGQQA